MNNDFCWLHLTDLHHGMREQHWLWPGVREIFFEDLKRLHEKSGPWDLVLFTGDLTQKGSAEEFRKLDEFFERLWKFFDSLGFNPRLLAVPGNHDLLRPSQKDPAVKLISQWQQQQDIQTEFWENAKSPYRRVVAKAFAKYTAWQERQVFIPKNLTRGILPGDFSVTIEKAGAKLGVVGLNTSFLQLSGGDYEKKLALHARQFHAACGGDGPDWARQHQACLFLTHHPPAWLDSDSRRHLQGEITAHGRFAVHLCGHMHEAAFRDIAEGGAEARRIWQGRSLFGLESFGEQEMREHGYAVGKIELKENKGSLLFWPREARLQGGQRSLVPDFSLNLTDAQHTEPKNVKLLRPYSGNSHKNALNPPLTKGEQLTVPEVKNADSSIDIAIITIIEEEYLAVKQHLHNTCSIQGTATNPNTHAWVSGEIDAPHLSIPYKVILAMAGEAGNNSGAIATNRTIERWKPRYVLLVGIAGGLPREGLVKGDVVLSSIIWDYEYGKIDNGFKPRMDFTYRVDGPLLRSGKIFSRDKNWNWRDKIIASPPEPEHTPKVITGPIASGNKVVDNITDEFFERVLEAWPKIQAVEMEGAGAAFAIEAAKEEGRAIGFFMVRGISDMPENSTAANRETDSSQTEERDSWKEYAADAAASFALGWVQSEYWPVQPRAAQAAPSPQQTNERIEQPGATQAEPSPQQTDEGIEQPEMPGKEDQIIEELLVCPSMETTEGSAAVLGKLPRHIRQAIARSTYPRILGLNMVTTCLNYPDGMQALLDAVRFFDKGTKEFIRFEEIVSETGMQ